MRRFVATVVVCTLALTSWGSPAVRGDEEITYEDYEQRGWEPCGMVLRSNASFQIGLYAWIRYIVATQASVDICGQWMTATGAMIAGVPASSASSGWHFMLTEVTRDIPVPNYNQNYTTQGVHAWTTFIPLLLVNGTSASQAMAIDSGPQDDEYYCLIAGGTWDGSHCALPNCPIIVDAGRDGYNLTNVDNGVRFDLNADGVAELVAWTRRDSDDAFLAMDRNGNGTIDNGSELFGNRTPTTPAGGIETSSHGFDALRFAEMPAWGSSVQDGVINRRDSIFRSLWLWTDKNHNGVSEPDELQTLTDAGLKNIDTDYKDSKRVDRHGNLFKQKSRVEWAGGDHGPVFDVWLKWRH